MPTTSPATTSPASRRPPATEASPLRVLVVTGSPPRHDGTPTPLDRVLDHLAEDGHHVRVVADTGPDRTTGLPVPHRHGTGASGDARPGRTAERQRGRLRRVVAEHRPDVVHLDLPAGTAAAAARVVRELGVPTVAVLGEPGRAQVLAPARAVRTVRRRADRVLVPSVDALARGRAAGLRGLAVWPSGVDADRFHPAMRSAGLRRRLAPAGELLVGYVGPLTAAREPELLAHVARLPDARLVVIGRGPEELRLRRLLPDAVFTGDLGGEDLAATYASLDVLVHPGRRDSTGGAVLEALASGVPVVASAGGAAPDLVRSGRNGFLHRPGDGRALAAYVHTLLVDAELRHRVAEAARPSVQDRTCAAVGADLVRHYRELAGGSARHAPGLPVLSPAGPA